MSGGLLSSKNNRPGYNESSVTPSNPLQIQRRRNIGKVAERLRCISQLGAAKRDFLGEHPDMVAEVGDGLEHGRRRRQVLLAVFPRPHQRFNQPERAHHERPFAATNSCIVETES